MRDYFVEMLIYDVAILQEWHTFNSIQKIGFGLALALSIPRASIGAAILVYEGRNDESD